MNYKISVIIPVYNAEKYLEETIESLRNQTLGFENLQVILVDDASKDNSKQIMKKFAQKFNNIIEIYLEKSHSTGGVARNEGLKHATGEYLMFLDSDDCYTKNACELMYNMATTRNADVVTANYRCMTESGELWENETYDKTKYPTCDLDEVNEKLFYLYCPSACMKIFNMKMIKENSIRFLEGVSAEDAFFTTEALLKSKKNSYLSEEIYYYRRRNTCEMSTSWMRNKNFFMGMSYAFKEIYKLFEENNKIEYYKYYYAKNFMSLIYKFIDTKLLTKEERIEVIDEMKWLFEQTEKLNIKINQKGITLLIKYALNKEYENVSNICEVISEARSFMTEFEKDTMAKPSNYMGE